MRNDQKVNLTFVKIVQENPDLYDKTLESYGKGGSTDSSWSNVVAAVKEQLNQEITIEEAKNRWRGIRSSFARYKKNLHMQKMLGKVTINKYYLYDALKFLEPFARTSMDNALKDDNEYQEDTDYAVSEYDGINGNNEEEFDLEAKNVTIMHNNDTLGECSSSVLNESSKHHNRYFDAKIDRSTMKKSRKRKDIYEQNVDNFVDVEQYVQSDAEMEFFKSIVPDIKHFTPKQKRKFKVRILQLIDEIEEEIDV